MRYLIPAVLLLASCHSDAPTGTSDDSGSFTPPDGVLRAAAVQAKPGDEAAIVVTGAKLTALRAAYFKLPNPGDADSLPARFTIDATQDSATVTVRVPDHGNHWDLFLAFPAGTRRLVAPLRVSLPPPDTAGSGGTLLPPTLDSAPVSIKVPPGLGTNVRVTGHGLEHVVSVALVASGTTAVTDAAVTLQDGGETEMDLTIMLRPTAVPGSAYDLVVTTGSTGPTFTVTKPRFVVVDAAYQPPILEFPTGTDSLRQGDLLQNQPWLCPNQYYTYASLCGLLLVRLPASGNLTTRLAWHASSDPDDGFYGRLRVDPPGHVTQSFKSPITMVTHGSAGDLMRITVDGFVVAGFIDFLFAPDP